MIFLGTQPNDDDHAGQYILRIRAFRKDKLPDPDPDVVMSIISLMDCPGDTRSGCSTVSMPMLGPDDLVRLLCVMNTTTTNMNDSMHIGPAMMKASSSVPKCTPLDTRSSPVESKPIKNRISTLLVWLTTQKLR